MAVRPATYRIEKWDKKMSGDLISANALAYKDTMKQQVSIQFPLLEELENAVKVILGDEGVDVYQNVWYINAGREMWRKHNKFAGNQLIYECNIILQKYVSDGFVQAILERIRDVVITLPAPGP